MPILTLAALPPLVVAPPPALPFVLLPQAARATAATDTAAATFITRSKGISLVESWVHRRGTGETRPGRLAHAPPPPCAPHPKARRPRLYLAWRVVSATWAAGCPSRYVRLASAGAEERRRTQRPGVNRCTGMGPPAFSRTISRAGG